MKEIVFFVPGPPNAKGRPRSTRTGIVYTPTKTRKAEESFVALAAKHRPPKPVDSAIQLQLGFALPIPQSKSKKVKAGMAVGEIHHLTRPDIDNLEKLVMDAMNGIFWVDDKQVVFKVSTKQYSDMPGTHVAMKWWGDA